MEESEIMKNKEFDIYKIEEITNSLENIKTLLDLLFENIQDEERAETLFFAIVKLFEDIPEELREQINLYIHK